MDRRPLGRTGLHVSPIGFGAFKIGRNVGIKYETGYELPDDDAVRALLNGALAAGVNYIDTAPAYGTSEERIGAVLSARGSECVISTKVGEEFEDGRSRYDFSDRSVHGSIARSRLRLRRDVLDIVYVHAPANDLSVLTDTTVVATLKQLKSDGLIRAIGFSGKTLEAERLALDWADVLMVEYNPLDRSHVPIIAEASRAGVGVVVKKGLASGRLDPAEAIPFILGTTGVTSLVIGGLNLDHFAANIHIAQAAMRGMPPPHSFTVST